MAKEFSIRTYFVAVSACNFMFGCESALRTCDTVSLFPSNAAGGRRASRGRSVKKRGMAYMLCFDPLSSSDIYIRQRSCSAGRLPRSWVCGSCQNVNFPSRETCNRRDCGAKREDVDAGPPPSPTSLPLHAFFFATFSDADDLDDLLMSYVIILHFHTFKSSFFDYGL